MSNGGSIEIKTRFDRQTNNAEILFGDSGAGIDDSAIAHLFEPMWTTKAAGSGFGLAIAREIANEHGGKIEVVEDRRPGVVFRLILPVAVAQSLAQEVVNVA